MTALDAYWMVYLEVVWNQGYASILSLFFNVVCSLALLLFVNALLRRARPAWTLTTEELLLVYVMASLGTATAAWGEYLMALLAFPYRYAAAYGWTETILPRLPRWLTVADPDAVRDYFAGNASLYRLASIRPWLLPLSIWAAGIMALVATTLCMASLARRQWTEHERLAYPLAQIPLQMTRPEGGIFRSPLFWIGFALAGGVNVLNALHLLVPAVPELIVKRHPWEWEGLGLPLSALNPVYVSWNPFLLGLEFFLPVDLLFSLWFFYGLARLEGVLFASIGVEPPGKRRGNRGSVCSRAGVRGSDRTSGFCALDEPARMAFEPARPSLFLIGERGDRLSARENSPLHVGGREAGGSRPRGAHAAAYRRRGYRAGKRGALRAARRGGAVVVDRARISARLSGRDRLAHAGAGAVRSAGGGAAARGPRARARGRPRDAGLRRRGTPRRGAVSLAGPGIRRPPDAVSTGGVPHCRGAVDPVRRDDRREFCWAPPSAW